MRQAPSGAPERLVAVPRSCRPSINPTSAPFRVDVGRGGRIPGRSRVWILTQDRESVPGSQAPRRPTALDRGRRAMPGGARSTLYRDHPVDSASRPSRSISRRPPSSGGLADQASRSRSMTLRKAGNRLYDSMTSWKIAASAPRSRISRVRRVETVAGRRRMRRITRKRSMSGFIGLQGASATRLRCGGMEERWNAGAAAGARIGEMLFRGSAGAAAGPTGQPRDAAFSPSTAPPASQPPPASPLFRK